MHQPTPRRCEASPGVGKRTSKNNTQQHPDLLLDYHLFLSSSFLLLSLSPLVLLALVSPIGTGETEGPESILPLLGSINDPLLEGALAGGRVEIEDAGDRDDLLDILNLLGGSIAFHGGLCLAGEQDEPALVFVQPGDVLQQGLDGLVLAAVVDGDAN